MMVLSDRNPAPSCRLPSFAKLNERLSVPDSPLLRATRQDGRPPRPHPTRLPKHSRRSSSDEPCSSCASHSVFEDRKNASRKLLLDPETFNSVCHRSYIAAEHLSAVASGLTAPLFPLTRPCRLPSYQSSSRGAARGSTLTRKATIHQDDGSSQDAHDDGHAYSIAAPTSLLTVSTPRSSRGERGRSSEVSSRPSRLSRSASLPTGHRYHPFAPSPTVSLREHRMTAISAKRRSTRHATCEPRRKGNFPKDVTDLLKRWLMQHSCHPYPSEDMKKQLCTATGLSMSQLSNWLINARRRLLVPQRRAAAEAPPAATTCAQKASAGGNAAEHSLNFTQPDTPSIANRRRLLPLTLSWSS